MSSTQLWAPTPKRVELNAADKLNTQGNMVPGTWLQLSPIASTAVSPALHAEPNSSFEVKEELTLRPANDKFLSNNFVSRSSSMSSEGSAPVVSRHPPLASKAFHVAPSVERRELAVGRAGGLAAVFGGN